MQTPPTVLHERFLAWFNTTRISTKIPLGCGSIIGILTLCSICSALNTTTSHINNRTIPPTHVAIASVAPTVHATTLATAVATVAPTQQPTSIPTATPVPRPQTLAISFIQASPGDVSVHTLPGASLTIKVLYGCSGHYATSHSLRGTEIADSAGNYTWIWTVESKCHGAVTAFVDASANGQTVSNQTSFTD